MPPTPPPAWAGTTLYLARHGQSEWNHQSRITGQTDIGLSPQGVAQSDSLAQCLTVVPLRAIYASALQRTISTAQPTAEAQGLGIVSLPGLNEIHLGELQGRFRDERDPDAQALWAQWQADPWNFCVPGGERFADFAQRVHDALQRILQQHAGQEVLVVGHRATNRVLLGHLLGWPIERWGDLQQRHKFCYRLRLGAAQPQVDSFVLSGSQAGTCSPGLQW
jgi:broad specificity phosphatase PhoE